jgi:hypothetical protein
MSIEPRILNSMILYYIEATDYESDNHSSELNRFHELQAPEDRQMANFKPL